MDIQQKVLNDKSLLAQAVELSNQYRLSFKEAALITACYLNGEKVKFTEIINAIKFLKGELLRVSIYEAEFHRTMFKNIGYVFNEIIINLPDNMVEIALYK